MAEAAADSLIEQKLLDIVAKEGMLEQGSFDLDTELDKLSIESADMVMILMAIEEEFGVYVTVDDELAEAKTVGDLVALATREIKAGTEKASA